MNDEEMMTVRESGRQVERLRAIMHRLRAPGGCPWDAEQSHESLVTNLIEEAYETVDAIRRQDFAHLEEELGDLLLQVVFHCELTEEAGRFTLDDVARGISDKLVRRHPHVFGTANAADSSAVLTQWDQIKRAEKGDEAEPYLHRVGKGLPALQRAAKLQKKAAKVGFDWPDDEGVIEKIREEFHELEESLVSDSPEFMEEELGDLMFSVVNFARRRGLDPEVVMEAANRKFETRFGVMEKRLIAGGETLGEVSLKRLDEVWNQAKEELA
jgi:MazG family protein